jgi:ArsR family transcriptional regulator, arsenate/arsenite/antimonite-responsive transcriptional repressor
MPLESVCTPGSGPIQAVGESEEREYLVLLKALGHPVRLRMVNLMHASGGELCVCQFEAHFELTQPTISHHLKILKDARLVQSRQDGTWIHHRLNIDSFSTVAGYLASISNTEQPDIHPIKTIAGS